MPASSVSSPWISAIFAIGTVVAGVAAASVAIAIQRTFKRNSDPLPPYPIILRPQRWIIITFCITALFLGAVALRFMIHKESLALGAIMMLLTVAVALKSHAISRESVTIEPDRLIHQKWGARIEIEASDVASYTMRNDYLKIKRKSTTKVVSISLLFQNIRYLNAVLTEWLARQSEPSIPKIL